jgi:hypothetical protein
MYIGKTPETELLVSGHRMPANSSNADYVATLAKFRCEGRSDSVHPAEEVCSREMMRTPGKQPRILLTNVKQLELLLTRRQDVAVKNNRPLMRPVAHAFIRGISGGVVSFPQGNTPKVWLSSADELTKLQDNAKVWRPRLFTCTTCGQHYFLTFLKDFDYSAKAPQGGSLAINLADRVGTDMSWFSG